MEAYKIWCSKQLEDSDLAVELKSIATNEAEIFNRFYKELG